MSGRAFHRLSAKRWLISCCIIRNAPNWSKFVGAFFVSACTTEHMSYDALQVRLEGVFVRRALAEVGRNWVNAEWTVLRTGRGSEHCIWQKKEPRKGARLGEISYFSLTGLRQRPRMRAATTEPIATARM